MTMAVLYAINILINLAGKSASVKWEVQIANVNKWDYPVADLIGAYDSCVSWGYGEPTDGMVATISILATEQGIFLNQVFSGQGMAEMIDLIQKGVMEKDKNVYFLYWPAIDLRRMLSFFQKIAI